MKSPLEHLRDISKKRKAMLENDKLLAKRMQETAKKAAEATQEPSE